MSEPNDAPQFSDGVKALMHLVGQPVLVQLRECVPPIRHEAGTERPLDVVPGEDWTFVIPLAMIAPSQNATSRISIIYEVPGGGIVTLDVDPSLVVGVWRLQGVKGEQKRIVAPS